MDIITSKYFAETEGGLLLCFRGYMTQKLLEALKTILTIQIEQKGSPETACKVFSVLVELVQNVIHYSGERISYNEEGAGTGTVAISYYDNKFSICCSNLINKEDVDVLDTKLKKILAQDKNQLREYFKKRMREGPEAGSKGSGLGFIDIARKSTSVEYCFDNMEEKVLFSIKVVL